MFYLELGVLPVEKLIQRRRLMFLKYILNQSKTRLIRRVFDAQRGLPLKGDWARTVEDDIIELKLNLTIDEIELMKTNEFEKIVKEKSEEKGFCDMRKKLKELSKVKNINFEKLETTDYLNPNKLVKSTEEKRRIF